MIKANKKSLNAKAYISGKVNDMREQFCKAPDEEARKQLVETFRETISSDEYQENLRVVNEDAKTLRKSLKPWERTTENFEAKKEEFYWKLNAHLSDKELKELQGKDIYEKLDFLCKKFWFWNKLYSMIVHMAKWEDFIESFLKPGTYNFRDYSGYIRSVSNRLHTIQERIEHVWSKKLNNLSINNIEESTFSISSHDSISTWGFELVLLSNPSVFSDDIDSIINRVVIAITTGEWRKNRYINTIDDWEKYFWKYGIKNFEKYHKTLANRILEYCWWRTDFLEKHINAFTWLTDEEKSEILWRDLAKEKFDADLARLQELWAKLWKQIVVKDIKEEVQEQNVGGEESVHVTPETPVNKEDEDDEVYVIETKKRRRGLFRRK